MCGNNHRVNMTRRCDIAFQGSQHLIEEKKKCTEEPSFVFMERMSMNIDLILKRNNRYSGIILTSLLTKSGREEMAMMTTLAGVVVVLFGGKEIVNLFDTVKALFILRIN